MTGHVDEAGRELLPISIANSHGGPLKEITAWIDTAFDGHRVMPMAAIREWQLEALAEAEGILADGSRVALETDFCYVEWFGERIPLQVIAVETP